MISKIESSQGLLYDDKGASLRVTAGDKPQQDDENTWTEGS